MVLMAKDIMNKESGNVENSAVKNSKQTFIDRMKERNANYNADDEEGMFAGINADYDNYENELNGYKDRESKIVDMVDRDPRSAAFLASWSEGEDPVITLVKQFGTEIADAIDDPKKADEIASANREYLEKVAKNKELEDTYTKNMESTLDVLGQWQEDNGYSDDEMDSGLGKLSEIAGDFIQGKITPETLQLIFKANNYDADVADAHRKGEVTGRNAKIKEQLRKPQGDGLPSMTTKAAPATTEGQDLGALSRYGNGATTIEERGGMRRIKHN